MDQSTKTREISRTVIPKIVFIGNGDGDPDTAELYRCEDRVNKAINAAADALTPIQNFDPKNRWREAVPAALCNALDSFQTENGIAAAIGFLRNYGFTVTGQCVKNNVVRYSISDDGSEVIVSSPPSNKRNADAWAQRGSLDYKRKEYDVDAIQLPPAGSDDLAAFHAWAARWSFEYTSERDETLGFYDREGEYRTAAPGDWIVYDKGPMLVKAADFDKQYRRVFAAS